MFRMRLKGDRTVGQHEQASLDPVEEQGLKPAGNSGRVRSILSFLLLVALVFGFVWAMKSFVYQAYSVPTGSMEDTIMPGDMLFAEKITFRNRAPEPGEIVTFLDPRTEEERVLIKRVIAVGGQTIDLIKGDVYIDGVMIKEPYTLSPGNTFPLQRSTITYPYTIPEGYIWVMGDNRENSTDSRGFGPVSLDAVLERAVFIYWPFDHFGSLYKE